MNNENLSDVNLSILHFLWTWKLATTAGLHQKFCPESSGHAFYVRLWRLERERFITTRKPSLCRDTFWVLAPRGFAKIKYKLPPLKEERYLPDDPHDDQIVAAIHLGDGLFEQIEGLEYFTSQQIKRVQTKSLPDWGQPLFGYTPDGIWHVTTPVGSKAIALEVVCFPMKLERNHEAVIFYNTVHTIDRVLWVTANHYLREKIQKNLNRIRAHEKHNFISLESIYLLGWQAPIEAGPDNGKTICELLVKTAQKSRKNFYTRFTLDARKTPHKSKVCKIFYPPVFSY